MSDKVHGTQHGSKVFRRKTLALSITASIAVAFSGGAFAQATTGTIHGTVPVAPNETIQITGTGGFNRTIAIGPSGTYSITLPVGIYTVSLLQNGQVVKSRQNVSPAAAGSVAVDFSRTANAANVQTLSTVNVVATAIPAIDVTTTNLVTTTTARQLEALPLDRSSGSIALLAPGVSVGAMALARGPLNTQLLVFGGASVAENAYYIDGMNTTDQITGQGGVTMPYGSLLQQQTFTSGYSAKYGRSIGGVINQIGKSGSNEWHFGVRGIWEPSSWQSAPVNQYFANPRYTQATLGDGFVPSNAPGQLNTQRSQDNSQMQVYDVYVSGPIIRNKLTFFLSAEQQNESGNNVSTVAAGQNTFFHNHAPKIYAKLNWNINENNQLQVSGLENSNKSWSAVYDYDNDTNKTGAFEALNQTTKNTFRVWVANYTSYITDNLTLHAMFGKTHGEYFTMAPSFPGFDPDLPHINNASQQNPAYLPPGSKGISNAQTANTINDPAHRDSVTNYRVDLEYKLGNHDLTVGIDNMNTNDIDDGNAMTGPGYQWAYGHNDPDIPIVGTTPSVPPYAGPPGSVANGASGFFVAKNVNTDAASVRVTQRAQYIQDSWQVTPNFLLNLGLRNDQFTNYNPAGEAYIRLTKPQWGPRLGFAWDVHGDSTLKVFGNAGRYYLALPAGVALRGAGASNFYSTFYTYTGIDPNTGEPLGLTQIPMNNGGHAGKGVSANNEYGEPLDPKVVSSQNVKAEYSDNFSLGMQQAFHMNSQKYVFGANAILEKMGPDIVDDWDDEHQICATAIAQGVVFPGDPANNLSPTAQCVNLQPGAVLINPTQTSKMFVKTPDGQLHLITVTNADQLFTSTVKRKYYAVNLSLEHPFDGKWYGKIIYTWSRQNGNTEGPVDSVIGQGATSVSITEQWDFWQLMDYSLGVLPNNHTNQLKAYGYYQLNPEWQVSANVFIESGSPKDCLGQFGPDETDPYGYGSAYHWCGGVPTPPGSTGNTPWTHQVALGLTYTPAWAQHKLAFNLSVQNLLNNQTVVQYFPRYGTTDSPRNTFLIPEGWISPRIWRLEVSYNW